MGEGGAGDECGWSLLPLTFAMNECYGFCGFCFRDIRSQERRLRVRQSAGGVINFPQAGGHSRVSLGKSSLRTAFGAEVRHRGDIMTEKS